MSSKHWNNVSDLQKNRISATNRTYFVTFVSAERMPWVSNIASMEHAKKHLTLSNELVQTYAMILMPDHVHWLFKIVGKTSLGQLVRMMKYKILEPVKGGGKGWQKNYFEHQLRMEEIVEPYAQYIFLNPYRKDLISLNEKWPFWIGNTKFQFKFEAMVEENEMVPKQWINEVEDPLKKL